MMHGTTNIKKLEFLVEKQFSHKVGGNEEMLVISVIMETQYQSRFHQPHIKTYGVEMELKLRINPLKMITQYNSTAINL